MRGQTQREDGDDTGRPLHLAEDQGNRIDDQTGGDNFDPTDDLASFDDDVLFAPVSTRFPTARRSTEDPIANFLVNDYDSFVDNEVMFSKNMLLAAASTSSAVSRSAPSPIATEIEESQCQRCVRRTACRGQPPDELKISEAHLHEVDQLAEAGKTPSFENTLLSLTVPPCPSSRGQKPAGLDPS